MVLKHGYLLIKTGANNIVLCKVTKYLVSVKKCTHSTKIGSNIKMQVQIRNDSNAMITK